MGKYTYPSLKERIRTEYKIYILAFLFIFAADSIGQVRIPLGPGKFVFLAVFYSLLLGMVSGPELTKIVKTKEVKAASKLVIVAICRFIAKLENNAGASLSGSSQQQHSFAGIWKPGNYFSCNASGTPSWFEREAIGATHSINRETIVALITDMYGPESPEARGSLSIYIVGGMVGTIYFGFMVSVVALTGIFHPYALGMASGVGAGIMMASATASLAEIYPAMADEISALASASETISGIDGIYMAIFIGIPLCNFLYKKLEPKIGRFADKKKEKKA